MHPEWLPQLFAVNPWQLDTIELLYRIFQNDFISSTPIIDGKPVRFFPGKSDGKEDIFWHITSREDGHDRLPDFRRCERLPWARPLLDHCPSEDNLLFWDYKEGDKSVKTYAWLVNLDYIVIMKKMSDGRRFLITAYWIEYENVKKKLKKKYDDRIKVG